MDPGVVILPASTPPKQMCQPQASSHSIIQSLKQVTRSCNKNLSSAVDLANLVMLIINLKLKLTFTHPLVFTSQAAWIYKISNQCLDICLSESFVKPD